MKQLFDTVVSDPCPSFVATRDEPVGLARGAMEEAFATFQDPDGNFIQQFQTTGFDSRVFELYLQAGFIEQGFEIERHEFPDFILKLPELRFAVEATTVNPSTSGAIFTHGTQLSGKDVQERMAYVTNELPIRIGSPLLSKVRKKYWEAGPAQDLPFVIAFQTLHDPQALSLSYVGVRRYLYGNEFVDPRVEDGRLEATERSVDAHTLKSKTIPSAFFNLPGNEFVSAVLFTNAGTKAKFTRMAYAQAAPATVRIVRTGMLFNAHPEARDASFFTWDIRAAPQEEHWGDGLVLFHNPRAVRPLPDHAFQGIAQIRGKRGELEYMPPGYIFSSETLCWPSTEGDFDPVPSPPVIIESIPGAEGRSRCTREFVDGTDDTWFADQNRQVLGVVWQSSDEWLFEVIQVLGKGWFEPTGSTSQLYQSRELAVRTLQGQLARLLL